MKRLWLDIGDLGVYVRPAGAHDRWQDHGLGLLRTILTQKGVETDLLSTRSLKSWKELPKALAGYDMVILNVHSYTFPFAYKAAREFKKVNPKGIVLAGGMHATVAPDEMEAIEAFDKVCQGPGENTIVDLVQDPSAFPRMRSIEGERCGWLVDAVDDGVRRAQRARLQPYRHAVARCRSKIPTSS